MKNITLKLSILFFSLSTITTSLLANDWADSFRLESENKYFEAAKAIEKYTKTKVVSEFAVIRHGWLNYLVGNYNSSIEDYLSALRINPNSLDARLGLLLPLLAQTRWREAALHAKKVLDVAPWQYHAHIRLMIAEEAQLQWSALEKHASAVVERYPSDATAQVYLARAYASLGKKEPAILIYRKVLQMVPGHIEVTRYLSIADAL